MERANEIRVPGPDAGSGRPATIALSPGLYAALLCAVFVTALMIRSPSLLLAPRMWAEEGRYYYQALQDLQGTSAWTLVVRGNYQLMLNLAAAVAVRVPAVWAAHVTTGFALAVNLVVIGLLGKLAAQQSWAVWPTCAAVFAIALLSQGYEIYLTATNVQWLASVSVLLLAVLWVPAWSRSWQFVALAWTALCALSGVPAVILAPVMLVRGWVERSRIRLAMGSVLAAGAVIHLAVILTHSHEGRAFTLNPFITVVGFLAQSIVSPVAGAGPTNFYLAAMRDAHGQWFVLLLLAATVSAAWLVVKTVAAQARGRSLAVTLGAAAVLCTVINVLGSIGPQDELVSSWTGGRYFILAAICWLLLLCACASGPARAMRLFAIACLVLAIASGLREVHYGRWKNFLVAGPSWRTTVEKCHERRPCLVSVWPGGPDWSLTLVRP